MATARDDRRKAPGAETPGQDDEAEVSVTTDTAASSGEALHNSVGIVSTPGGQNQPAAVSGYFVSLAPDGRIINNTGIATERLLQAAQKTGLPIFVFRDGTWFRGKLEPGGHSVSAISPLVIGGDLKRAINLPEAEQHRLIDDHVEHMESGVQTPSRPVTQMPETRRVPSGKVAVPIISAMPVSPEPIVSSTASMPEANEVSAVLMEGGNAAPEAEPEHVRVEQQGVAAPEEEGQLLQPTAPNVGAPAASTSSTELPSAPQSSPSPRVKRRRQSTRPLQDVPVDDRSTVGGNAPSSTPSSPRIPAVGAVPQQYADSAGMATPNQALPIDMAPTGTVKANTPELGTEAEQNSSSPSASAHTLSSASTDTGQEPVIDTNEASPAVASGGMNTSPSPTAPRATTGAMPAETESEENVAGEEGMSSVNPERGSEVPESPVSGVQEQPSTPSPTVMPDSGPLVGFNDPQEQSYQPLRAPVSETPEAVDETYDQDDSDEDGDDVTDGDQPQEEQAPAERDQAKGYAQQIRSGKIGRQKAQQNLMQAAATMTKRQAQKMINEELEHSSIITNHYANKYYKKMWQWFQEGAEDMALSMTDFFLLSGPIVIGLYLSRWMFGNMLGALFTKNFTVPGVGQEGFVTKVKIFPPYSLIDGMDYIRHIKVLIIGSITLIIYGLIIMLLYYVTHPVQAAGAALSSLDSLWKFIIDSLPGLQGLGG